MLCLCLRVIVFKWKILDTYRQMYTCSEEWNKHPPDTKTAVSIFTTETYPEGETAGSSEKLKIIYQNI